jgi:hypothetical protein
MNQCIVIKKQCQRYFYLEGIEADDGIMLVFPVEKVTGLHTQIRST